MNITPGEPVPPGFEDEVDRVAEIQRAIDQYKGNALIGLEYALELHDDTRHEPGYYCSLCDKRGDPRTIMQHWTSFNHRLKYLDKHFPTAMRECNAVKYKPNSHSIMIIIVQSLSEAIEDHYGRMTPSVYSADDFRRMKTKIINELAAKTHFDEQTGPNFVHVIDRTLWERNPPAKKLDHTLQITIKAPKRLNAEVDGQETREQLDEISSDSDGQTDPAKKAKKREQSPAYRVLPRVRRSPPFEEERDKKDDKKLPTPKQLSLQASHIAQERYKWEKYRCMLEIQLKQMEKIQQDYEKNPEKHPLYPDEWKSFWNRRYKELQAEKKVDPNKYDYKPEWIVFWTKRMKSLFDVEVEKKKKEIKVKLGLPEDAEEKIDLLKEKYKVQVTRNLTAGTATSSSSRDAPSNGQRTRTRERERERDRDRDREREKPMDVIDISDDEDTPAHRRRRATRSRSRSRRHSHSDSPHARRIEVKRSRSKSPPADDYDRYGQHHHHHHHHRTSSRSYPPTTEADYYAAAATYSRARHVTPAVHYGAPTATYRVMDPYSYPKYERSPSPHSKSASVKEDIAEPEDTGPLTVVAVLRLLTALEEHLGSMGPKVVDLLGKALALEKVKANSADDLLLNEDHVVFFETIKEKLKGLLIADMIEDQQKVRAVKKAIKNIAAVVHQVNVKGKQAEANADESNASGGTASANANKKKISQVPNVKDLPFDRQLITTKLAAALVMQGREDVSTEDMDKLIFMFILMVKLSKGKSDYDDKPLHTRDILPEVGVAVPQPVVTPSDLAALPAIVDELFEKEVTALVQEVEEDFSNDTSDKDSKNDANSSMLESLTDSDLQTLLQNFKHLSTEEQHHLIAHLKKLETADPGRVEKLRKFVNLSDLADAASTSTSATANSSRPKQRETVAPKNASSNRVYENSPIPGIGEKSRSNYSDDETDKRPRGVNVSNPNKFTLDDDEDEDDYNFDDVFKAASSNVKRLSESNSRQTKNDSSKSLEAKASAKSAPANEPIVPVSSSANALTFNPAGLNISLADTQNIIANLMGSLQQSNESQNSSSKTSQQAAPQPVPSLSTAHNIQANAPYYQQQQQQQQSQQQAPYGGSYNQMPNMGNPQAAAYYNVMGSYNNPAAAAGYGNYQPWGNGQQQMPQFGIQNFIPQQQQQQQQHQMGYNMYGGRGGN